MGEPSDALQGLVPYASSIASLESLLSKPAPLKITQKFLRVRVEQENTALLPIEEVVAVLTIAAGEVLPIPQMNASVLGVFNWRGEALWLVDLSHQIGFKSFIHQSKRISTLTVIVMQRGSQLLGLVVPEVRDIEEHYPDQLYPPSKELFSPRFLPFVKGYFLHDHSVVLDMSAVLHDSRLRIYEFNTL
jgi:positive phototaxis protein PixI